MNKPYIIAEIGSNWVALEDCLNSIAQAKQAGADAVKFQLFDHHALFGTGDGHKDAATPMMGALPIEWIPKLEHKAHACGIDFLCSAFSPELLSAVNPYVSMHKVASAELTHVRVLERLRDFGKPVILSTGASGKQDIARALSVLDGLPVTLLYCVAAYPAQSVDFRMLDALKEFGKPVGFSDHTLDYIEIPRMATLHGATVIEKHMTALGWDTPDRPHSLTVEQFKKMVQAIKGELPFAWGHSEERDMIMRHNRRLIATRDIHKGQVIEENKNMGIYRSLKDDARGLSPWAIAKVHGHVATKDIKAGDAIGPGDFN